MKVISFDVGIKNMAYCLFTYETAPTIQSWDILNLGAIQVSKPPCSFCRIKASFQSPTQFFCKKHASKEILPQKKLNLLSKEDLEFLGNKKIQELNAAATSAGWSKKQWLEFIKTHMLTKIPSAKKSQNTNQISLIQVGRTMTDQLENLLANHTDITHVLIENQISPIAGRMKTIQGMLTQYFLLKNPTAHIEFISSHNKLKMTTTTTTKEAVLEQDAPKEKTKYKQNKTDAVHKVQEWIQGTDFAEFFQSSKKKDDLADCLLQGLWFVKAKI